jgi:hypothetical protein
VSAPADFGSGPPPDRSPEPASDWTPASWRGRPALHQPTYSDSSALASALGELARLPPLVTSWEIEDLKGQLSEAAAGRAFLLQGGDCAESFDSCTSPAIAAQLKVLLQMSLVLVHGARRPVIRAGRFAAARETEIRGERGGGRRDAPDLPRRPDQPSGATRRARARPAAHPPATSARR